MPIKQIGVPESRIRRLGSVRVERKKSDPPKPNVDNLLEIDNLKEDTAIELHNAGFISVKMIAEADPAELQKVKGMGKKNTPKIQESAQAIIAAKSPGTETSPEVTADDTADTGEKGLLEMMGIVDPDNSTDTTSETNIFYTS